jgi:DNA-directed RNA polymerase subunit F
MSEQVYEREGAQNTGNSEVSSTKPSEAEANGNEPVSKAELSAMMEKLKQDVSEDVLRKAQSHADKLGSQLDKRIANAQKMAEQSIKLAKATGLPLSPEQEEAIKRTAVNQAIIEQDNSAEQSQEVTPQPKRGSGFDLTANVTKIMEKTGVYISPHEADQLIGEVDSDYEYLSKFESLCKERSNKPISPETRIPTMTGQISRASSPDVLRQQYDNEMAQIVAGKHPTIRRGNAAEVLKLKEKYRKEGLTDI